MNGSFDPLALMRPDLAELVPYRAESHPGVVKLDANENPYDFPPVILEEIWHRMGKQFFNRYPDPAARRLVEHLSAYTGTGRDGIMVGNGSDEVILNLMLTFGTGGRVLIATPTFTMYGVHARIAGAAPVPVPRRAGFALDVEAIVKAARKGDTRLIFLCSPNNPTGNPSPPEEIAAILQNTRALVVVDEAYQEFGGESCLPLLEEYPNLVILRTLSKAFGLAGLRIGYLLADPAVVELLMRTKQPYNLNAFSQLAACTVLAHREEFNGLIKRILADREELFRELQAISGVEPFPTEANFILFRTSLPAERVHRELLARGVLIRNMHGPGLENCLRVTVGKRDENRLFLEKLKEVLGA
ncbi:MAG: histidinol-phosphate transaminase [Thermoanaerobacteraceae bacterium]|nr:histidinol-phosphate transaminase [Thermoanaerobacteraceae bacterium]